MKDRENILLLNSSSEILLFDTTCPKNGRLNVLKEFIYFLKFLGNRGKIDFAFSAHEESSHPGLSIKENYILDSVPTSLIKDREDNFKMTAQNLSNPFLKSLIKATECVDRIMNTLNPEEKKLVSIAKALLSQSEYVFMDRPDMNISSELLKTVKEALAFEARENGRKVLIRPEKQEKWLDLATHIVAKNDANVYVKTGNMLCSASKSGSFQELPASLHRFELIKKSA